MRDALVPNLLAAWTDRVGIQEGRKSQERKQQGHGNTPL